MPSWSDHEDKEIEFHTKIAEGNAVSLPVPEEGPAIADYRGAYVARIDQAWARAREERKLISHLEDDYQGRRRKRNAVFGVLAGVAAVGAFIFGNMFLDRVQGIDSKSLKEKAEEISGQPAQSKSEIANLLVNEYQKP